MKTTIYGYPKIGRYRELKTALESYWGGEITKEEMLSRANEVNQQRMKKYISHQIDLIPSGDFSLYDFVLDVSTMLDLIPERFRDVEDSLDQYFAMARGNQKAIACEMTKWFDTNYHYIVPELSDQVSLKKNHPLESYRHALKEFSLQTKPVLVGPFTFTYLSKIFKNVNGSVASEKAFESEKFEYYLNLVVEGYIQALKELEKEKCEYVQLDEPALVMDLSDNHKKLVLSIYDKIAKSLSSLKILIQTYYESITDYKELVFRLPVYGVGLDFVLGQENWGFIENFGFPSDKVLVAGLISGRDIWKTDFEEIMSHFKTIEKKVSLDRVILSNSSPLFHVPVTIEDEKGHLPEDLLTVLSFADEKLTELNMLKNIIEGKEKIPKSPLKEFFSKYENQEVRKKIQEIKSMHIERKTPFKERYEKQNSLLNLSHFPTTTIGSFPQTKELRKVRADYKAKKISQSEYDDYIKKQIENVIKVQEELGLDILVHGEFERSDMVEFFGEKLKGFAFTKNGWVQSYGSRCVRPPIIYGDVSRPEPMTLKEIVYAQSLTKKPVKGMLTGAVTILNWSFYRKDLPKEEIAYQIALALNEEVLDLQKAGIKIIQIDEPAFREGLPLKKSKQPHYLDWAVKAFRLSHFGVEDTTQIHTHMCYSEFDEIIEYIYKMDADVISIEASRSKGDIVSAFENFRYDKGIGLGVYDIHSPRVPTKEEMQEIVSRGLKVIDKGLFWINPDCGLKTRKWDEVIPSLRNMVEVAKTLREKV
ncbi:MAG: 5-methyltetrahydropteroyltriglutamate--homocysteine S-methyltransferase [Leptospiraceae bacterium]|nr:5-methyltetrahydropteroyltriglutamate--homocysteine S-methyltransferase [Leptospiraceae bacterium]MDW7976784.1 5-methyltetrahydropteroyltriglutamate--homocysteine S-methyltransferase [Leptospiraceae bacterium]